MVHNPPLPRNPPRGRRRSRGISGDRSSDDRPSDGPGRTPPRRGGEQEHHGEDSTTPHGSAVLPPLGSPTPPRYGGYHAQGYAYGPPHGVPPHLSHPLGNDPAAEDHRPAPVAPYGYYYQQYPGHGEGQGGVAYDAGHGGQPYGGGGYGPPEGQVGGGYSPQSQDYRTGGPGGPQQYRTGQDGRDDVRTEGSGGTAASSDPGGVGGGGDPAGGTPRRSPDSFILEVSWSSAGKRETTARRGLECSRRRDLEESDGGSGASACRERAGETSFKSFGFGSGRRRLREREASEAT